jgi:hypothetical protein
MFTRLANVAIAFSWVQSLEYKTLDVLRIFALFAGLTAQNCLICSLPYIQIKTIDLGLCPFQDDQRASFSVNAEKNYFQCLAGCGGGCIIDFWSLKWRKKQGLEDSFSVTISDLADMLL